MSEFKKPHNHRDIIIKWVNGAAIQGQSPSTDKWHDVYMFEDISEGNNFLDVSPIHPEYSWWDNWRVKD